MKEGSKYHPLFAYLRKQTVDEITLTFVEIKAILRSNLPPSAWTQAGWWSNRSKGALQAQAWMGAGYHVTAVDLESEQVTFSQPTLTYTIKRAGDTVLWDSQLVKGLRQHMKLTQSQLADELGVRQQTISEWEKGIYTPSRATSKYLTMVAERAGFLYKLESSSEETG